MKPATSDEITAAAKDAAAAFHVTGRLAYRVEDFAFAAGIGRTTVYAEIAAGRLKARKVGKRTLILDEDGRAFLSSLPELQAA